jgi:DMSO/TMAO reductase YedYZ heme-binding membrane subunit
MSVASWSMKNAAVVVGAAVVNFGVAAAVLASAGADETGTKFALRATARVAFLWFALAFSASSLDRIFRKRWTKWILARRRFIGAAFAAAFMTHVSMILWLYRVAPIVDAEKPVPLFDVAGGIVGLSTVYLMLLTSFDRTAALLGRKRWEILHRYGSFYVMTIFIYCFLEAITHTRDDLVSQAIGGLPPALYYHPFLALAVAAVCLRLYAARVRPSRYFAARTLRSAKSPLSVTRFGASGLGEGEPAANQKSAPFGG